MFALIRPAKTLVGLLILCMGCPKLAAQDTSFIGAVKAGLLSRTFPATNSKIATTPFSRSQSANSSRRQDNLQTFQYPLPARTQTNIACPDSSFLKIFEAKDRVYNYYASSKTNDGGIVLAGYGRSQLSGTPYTWYTVITKFDSVGKHIWSKELKSDVLPGRGLYAEGISVLSDGSIIITGWHDNPSSITPPTVNVDFFVAKLTSNGDLTWLKTFHSLLGLTCPTSNVRYAWVAEGSNGDLYLGATVPNCPWPSYLVVFKLNSAGNLIWQYNFTGHFTRAYCMGIFYEGSSITVINRGDGTNSYLYAASVDLIKLDASTGAYISHKSWEPDLPIPANFEASFMNWTPTVVRLNNGNYCVYGNTFGDFFNPFSANLPHFSVVEFNNNYDFVKGYTINSTLAGNAYESKIKVDRFGKVIYGMSVQLAYPDEIKYYGIADNGAIVHQRNKQINGLEVFYDNAELFDNGSVVYINNLATAGQSNFYLHYSLMHVTDTSSECLGTIDNFSNTSPIRYKPHSVAWTAPSPNPLIATVNQNNSVSSIDFTAPPPCYQKTVCDTLKINGDASSCDVQQDLTFTAFKNRQCGTRVNWKIDTSVLQTFRLVDDTTLLLKFDQPWQGWLYASISTTCGQLTDSVLITIYNSPGPVNIGPDTAFCQSNSVALNARKGYITYLWSNGATDSIITVTSPGTYYVTVTDACAISSADTVLVSLAPPIPITIGPDRTKCNMDTLHLRAPTGFMNYAWSPNYNISATNTQQVIVAPVLDTTYTLIAEKTPGCFAFDTVRITVNMSPQINLGPDQSFCAGDSLVLDAGNNFTQYQWSNGNTTSQITTFVTGVFSVIATTAEGCRSFDTLTVANVYSLPIVSLNKDSALCDGDQRILNAGSGFSNYAWNTGRNSSSITVKNIGMYAVTVTDDHGCKGSDTTWIRVIFPQPASFLAQDTSICPYIDKLELKANASFEQYKWNTGSSSSTITIKQPGSYWLQVTDDNGCNGKDTILIDPKDCGEEFFMPTGFTPNNDGKNDLLKPILLGNLVQYRFWIYNRWGQLVFETTDLTKSWDGNYKGQPQGSNVFVWRCTYQFQNKSVKNEKGTFILIR